MIAAHRKVMTLRVRIVPAFDLPHASPVDRGRVAVLFVAGNHAALATDTLRHVEVEAILLSRSRRAGREQQFAFHQRQCDRAVRRTSHSGSLKENRPRTAHNGARFLWSVSRIRLCNEPEWGLRTGVPYISPESPFVSLANTRSVQEPVGN